MAIVKQEIEYEFLTRWAHQLTLVNGKYELTKSISGSQVQKVIVIFDDETGEIIQAVTGKAHPVKDVAGVAGGDDIEVFAIDDLLTKIQSDAIGTCLSEKSRSVKLEYDLGTAMNNLGASISAQKTLSTRIAELESLNEASKVEPTK